LVPGFSCNLQLFKNGQYTTHNLKADL
jgi:hypothetical protein